MADDKLKQPEATMKTSTTHHTNTNTKSNNNSNNKKNNSSKKKRSTWKLIRWIVIPILFVTALIVGLILGYSYIGGEEASEVFQFETWKHLVDLIFAE